MKEHTNIKGWILGGSHPDHYEMKVDTKTFRTEGKSGLLQETKNVTEKEFATMMQSFKADNYKRKRIKLYGYLKTEDVGKCTVWMQVDNRDGDVIQFDNMNQRCIQGTTDWNQYSIVLDVPEESSFIHFGVLLRGQGKVWIDSLTFEIVDIHTPTTNMIKQEKLPEYPTNLSFTE